MILLGHSVLGTLKHSKKSTLPSSLMRVRCALYMQCMSRFCYIKLTYLVTFNDILQGKGVQAFI